MVSGLYSEIGVDVSPKCQTQKVHGQIMNMASDYDTGLSSTISLSAFSIVGNVNFTEGELERVQVGFPRHLRADTCFSCVPRENTVIVDKCSIRNWKRYEPGELQIGVFWEGKYPFTAVAHFQETTENPRGFFGSGDVVSNNNMASSFLFSASADNETVHYLEYNEKSHIFELRKRAKAYSGYLVSEKTRTSVSVKNISCEHNLLDAEKVAKIYRGYRTSQLEQLFLPLSFNESSKDFGIAFTVDSVYRAIYAALAIRSDREEGEFYVYKECGRYRWNFLIPIGVCVCITVVLWLVSYECMRRSWKYGEVSKDMQQWHCLAQFMQQRSACWTASDDVPEDWSTCRSLFDEAQLLDSDEGGIEGCQLMVRQRSKHTREKHVSTCARLKPGGSVDFSVNGK